ncbi:MAG: hypothetical protein RIT14_623, partial [Pseudomonadota bacterium]
MLGTAAWLIGATGVLAEEKHDIYTLMPNSELSGVIDPDMPHRSAINKALPTGPCDP